MKIRDYICTEVLNAIEKQYKECDDKGCYCYANDILLYVHPVYPYNEKIFNIKVYLPIGHMYYGKNYESIWEYTKIITRVDLDKDYCRWNYNTKIKRIYGGCEITLGGTKYWELNFTKDINKSTEIEDENGNSKEEYYSLSDNFDTAIEFLEKIGCGDVQVYEKNNELVLFKGKLIPLQKKNRAAYIIPVPIKEILSKVVKENESIEEILKVDTALYLRRRRRKELRNFLSLYSCIQVKHKKYNSPSLYELDSKISNKELLFIYGPVTNVTINTVVDTTFIDELNRYYKEKLTDQTYKLLCLIFSTKEKDKNLLHEICMGLSIYL